MSKKSIIVSTIFLPISSTSFGNINHIDDFYIVKEGESFSRIAEKMRFNYKGWTFKKRFETLLNENPQITDINKVFPGDKLSLPQIDETIIKIEKLKLKNSNKPKVIITKVKPLKKIVIEKLEEKENFASKKSLNKDFNYYLVKKGETLSQIAKKMIGHPVFDKEIGSLQLLLKYNLQIKSPNNIEIGDKIFIPSIEEIELYKFLKMREAKTHSSPSKLKNDSITTKPKIKDYIHTEDQKDKTWVKTLLKGDEHLNFLWCAPNC